MMETEEMKASDPRMPVLYISGPYSAPTPEGIKKNIDLARAVGIDLMRRGFAVIIPHCNTQNFEVYAPDLTHTQYLDMDCELLRRLDPKHDGIVMLPGYRESKGAIREFLTAIRLGLNVWKWPHGPGTCTIICEEEKDA